MGKFIADNFDSDLVDGVLTLSYNDKDAYKKGDDTVTADEIERVEKYSKAYIDEAITVVSGIAEEKMVKDSSINTVAAAVPYTHSSRGSVDVTVQREKVFQNRFAKEGEDPEIRKSTVQVVAKSPFAAGTKKVISELSKNLTEKLVK